MKTDILNGVSLFLIFHTGFALYGYTTVEPMPEGRVLYEESAECTSETRGLHKDQLASAWRVSHTLSFLKNKITGWLRDNMNVLLVRLNGSSIKDFELSKEITELQSCPLVQRTLKLLVQLEVILLATSYIGPLDWGILCHPGEPRGHDLDRPSQPTSSYPRG